MTIDKNSILSGAMNASNILSIANVFYIDRNFGKYQKQTLINKGDLVEVDTTFIDCKLEEHSIDIQNYNSTIELTDVMSDIVRGHIHNHLINYIASNSNDNEYIRFYKPIGIFKRLFSKKTKTKEQVIHSIESSLKQDSVILFSIHSFYDILSETSIANTKNMGFVEVGFIKHCKCYVVPTWGEKSVLIVNKNDLDVVINRKIKIEDKGDSISIILGMGVFKTQKCISKIDLI